MNLNIDEIDSAIEHVEGLYHQVTGQPVPEDEDETHAAIPPERDPIEYVQEQIDRLSAALGSLGAPEAARARPTWSPPVSVWQSRDRFVIQVDLPGVPRASIHVECLGATLSISGTRRPPSPDGTRSAQCLFSERPDGMFQRYVALPAGANAAELHAQIENGVLEIRMPRQEAPRPIKVN